MSPARLAVDGAARGTGDATWLVLDLVDAPVLGELTADLDELARTVDGVTVLVAPGPAGQAVADRARRAGAGVAQAAGAGAAQRLAGAEVPLPAEVGVIVYGDHRLLGQRASVAEALACLGAGDIAMAHGAPVTDSLRRVDDRGRLVACVDRTDLLALVPPHTLRREVVAEVAALAAAGGADGSVEAGLVRTARPVRVVELDATGGAACRAASAPSPAG